jgi:hypothetical protein
MSKLEDLEYDDEYTDYGTDSEQEVEENEEKEVDTDDGSGSHNEEEEAETPHPNSPNPTHPPTPKRRKRRHTDTTRKSNNEDMIDTFSILTDVVKKTRKATRKRKPKVVKEKKEEPTLSKEEVEKEVKKLAKEFGSFMTKALKSYQRRQRNGLLNDDHIDGLIETHNELRDSTQDKISILLESMPRNQDVDDRVYDYVNLYFDKQYARVERLIQV